MRDESWVDQKWIHYELPMDGVLVTLGSHTPRFIWLVQ